MGNCCVSKHNEIDQIPQFTPRQRPDASIRQQTERIEILPAETTDEMMIPWSYNAATNSDQEIIWKQYDHLTSLMIEILFRKFMAGDTSYQQIPISGYYVIDFKYMV